MRSRVPRFIMMVAMSNDRVIASNGSLPWHDTAELQFFLHTIRYHTCIMGRRTRDAIPSPDPSTKDYYVLSTHAAQQKDGRAKRYSDLDTMLAALPRVGPIFVLGGSRVYQEMLARALIDVAYVSVIPGEYYGDTYMPMFEDAFVAVKREMYPTYEFIIYEHQERYSKNTNDK